MAHVAARKVMRLQWIAPNIDAGFHRSDAVVHNQAHRYFAQPHPDHLAKTHRLVSNSRPEPETEKVKKYDREHQGEDRQYRDANQIKRFHIGAKIIGRETKRKGLIAEPKQQKVGKYRTRW